MNIKAPKNNIHRRALSMLLAAVLLFALFPFAAHADAPETALTPSAGSVSEGKNFTLALSVSGGGDFVGIQAKVEYDDALVEYNGVSPSPENEDGILVDVFEDDDGPGVLLIALNGSEAIPDGDTALTLSFTATAAGEADFEASDVRIVTRARGPAVSAKDDAATVTVVIPPAGIPWDGAGTRDDPYIIAVNADFIALRDKVNAGGDFKGTYFLLEYDLDLTTSEANWTPVGDFVEGDADDTPFSGVFDGGGHGITVYIEDSNAKGGDRKALFGLVRDAEFRNLAVYGSIKGYARVAGIVACVDAGTLLIENCENRAKVTAVSDTAAGIVADARGAASVTIKNCVNYGDADAPKNNASGILSRSCKDTTITGCVNRGNIKGYSACGIAGAGLVTDKLVVSECANLGDVSGTAAAGIGNGSTIINSYNAGAVSSSVEAYGIGFGGDIINCYNAGTVKGTGANAWAGGIMGRANGSQRVENCYNSGAVSSVGADKAGAVFGTIINSYTGQRVYNLTIANTYYLDSSSDVGMHPVSDEVTPVTSEQLRALAGALGTAFEASEDSYPILVWQLSDDSVTKTQTVDGGVVTATIKGADLSSFTAGGDSVYVSFDLRGGDTVTAVNATVKGRTLAALSEAGASLRLNTDLGDVTLDPVAIAEIAAAAGTGDVTLSARRPAADNTANDTVKALIAEGKPVYEFTLKAGDTPVFTGGAGSGAASVVLPYTRLGAASAVNVVVSRVDGADLTELTTGYASSAKTAAFTSNGMGVFVIEEREKPAVTPDPSADVWDGVSIDVSWYNKTDTVFHIGKPAELAGLAAVVNGIYNEGSTVFGDDGGGKIKAGVVEGASSGGNNMSTETYHYGADDFNGKTVYLDADLDMGGAANNFMPIGGQYLMSKDDSETKISASFNGTFDGQGHTVLNINTDRHCSTGNYGDGASVGLIGRLGVHDSEDGTGKNPDLRASNPTVKNVAVAGYIKGNRSVGGIVGKIGKTINGGLIENCANFATIVSTDKQGAGGIVGASWNGGAVRNCYNAGDVIGGSPAGGIVGANENIIENCYSVGTIYSESGSSFAMGVGTNNGAGATYDAVVINSYFLEGSAAGGGYYDRGSAVNDDAQSSDTMKSEGFLKKLGPAFAPDLTPNMNDGYPILTWQTYSPFDPGTPDDEIFSVSVIQPLGGLVSANIASGKKGATVILSVSPAQGYILDHCTVNGEAISGALFFLTEDAEVTAVMRERSGDYPPGWNKQRPSFGIYILNEDGRTGTLIGNWNYDGDKETYVDANGKEASFITTFNEPLIYSGIDRMPAARLGVVKKGILAEDLIAYYNANRGDYPALDKDSYTDFTMLASTNSRASEDPYTSNDPNYPGKWALYSVFDDFTDTTRYYYPDFLKGVNTGDEIKTKPLGQGVPAESVIAVTSYNDRVSNISEDAIGRNGMIDDDAELAKAVAYLLGNADNERALRNFDGMAPADNSGVYGADNPRLPLGADGSYWIGSVWITPPGASAGTPDPNDLVFSVDVPVLTGGVLTPSPAEALEGETITVAVYPRTGYRLVPGSLKYDGRAISADANGAYSFEMPAWDVTLSADFIEIEVPATAPEADEDAFKDGVRGSGDIYAGVWDGKSIDIRWFDPAESVYTINTPAELAGLAALVNGLYNREIDTVAGKASYIRVNTGLGDDDGPQGNNKSTPTYHYGDYDFAGKTVRLGRDIDMGERNNYMPIGGQYLMKPGDSTTRVDASFNGVFDGRNHNVTIKAERRVYTGNYGDGSSVGLIGRLGNHDNEGARVSGQAVRNVAVYGSVSANRSVGGVVGKIGKTIGGATIENCANFAAISSSDAKGVGGIVGAAWNGGVIRNCYNTGTVNGSHSSPAGGIAGSVEIPIENSYSRGRVTAPTGYAMGIGTNNGGAQTPVNSYYLAGYSSGGGWYTGGSADNSGARESAYMLSDEFVTLLGNAFVKDTNKINDGYPVLRWQGGTAVTTPAATPEDGSRPTVNVPSTTTVKDGEAVTVVDIPEEGLALADSPSSRLVVNVDTGGESVSKITAEMPAEFVKQASESKSDIEIRSEVANVLLPEKAVAGLAKEGKDVSVKAAKDEAANTYTFTVESAGKALPAVDGGIKAAIPAAEASAGTVAVLVYEDGTEEIIKKSATVDGELLVPLSGSATIRIEDRSKSFDDVTSGAWYADAVGFASSRELFTGTTESTFSPNDSMTRAMLVTVLHRLENEPETGAAAFTDVDADKYYSRAVAWASENGTVTGMGDGTFAPAQDITREQLAAMLYRYASAQGLDVSARSELSSFMDAGEVSAWASEALSWAVGAGIIAGRSNPAGVELAPKGTATRAEVAAMIERLIERATGF